MFLNIIGDHLQRSAELCLKYQLEKEGIEYPKTHNIDQLIRIGRENNADIIVTDYVHEHSEMLTLWEAQTGYVIGYRLELRKTEAALNGVRKFLETVAEQERCIGQKELGRKLDGVKEKTHRKEACPCRIF